MIIIKPFLLDTKFNRDTTRESLVYNSNLIENLKVDTEKPDIAMLKRIVDIILNNALLGGIELGYTGNITHNNQSEVEPLNELSRKKMEALTYLYDYDRYILDPSRAVMVQVNSDHSVPFQLLTNTRDTMRFTRELEGQGVDPWTIEQIDRFTSSVKNARCILITPHLKSHNALYSDKKETPNYTELALNVFRKKGTVVSDIHYTLDTLPAEFHERFMDFLSVELDAWICAIESVLNKSIRMLATNEQAELTTLLEGFDDGSFELTDLEHIYQSRDEIRQEIDRIYKECKAYS
ncbi:hypothetical protein [Vibrio crassostreae]|uniref:hypothetical protein n=1 Tax=Vibrio crassostreae TaxID=246167 RepID=UPI001B309C22|nr:hypothetical protein [Vibrio crassostreae]